MKTTFRLLRFLALPGSVLALQSCITSTTTVTDPDGTVTTTKTTAPAPGYDAAAVVLAGGLANRVVDDK